MNTDELYDACHKECDRLEEQIRDLQQQIADRDLMIIQLKEDLTIREEEIADLESVLKMELY